MPTLNIIISIAVFVGCFLIAAATIPVRNFIQDDLLFVCFLLGNKKVIDISESGIQEVPDDAKKHLVKVFGGNIGRTRMGTYRNIRTGNKYHLYLTGKGKRVYIESFGKKYIVDLKEN